jgi:hypothetical protein
MKCSDALEFDNYELCTSRTSDRRTGFKLFLPNINVWQSDLIIYMRDLGIRLYHTHTYIRSESEVELGGREGGTDIGFGLQLQLWRNYEDY